MNIKQAKLQVEYAVKSYLTLDDLGQPAIPVARQRPIFLLGAPGIGKTAIMEQIAQELGIGLVSYSMTHHTRQSALGLPFIVKKQYDGEAVEVSEYTMSEIISSIHDCMAHSGVRQGILFLDEINCVSETLAPSMLQFLQFKTFGRWRVPQGWVVVTAGNPPEFNNSVREFDIVTWDRLKRIDVEPDYDAWKEYALAQRVHPAVTSYLEIRKGDFYRIESSVDGKRFVTARGWVDLSDMIKLYEKNGFPVDETLIAQYLQNPQIAKGFSAYYDLFDKYRADYQVEAILSGGADEGVKARARAAKFDERLSLLALMTDALGEGIRRVLRDERALQDIASRLRADKARFTDADAGSAAALLNDAAEAVTRANDARRQANALSEEDARAGLRTVRLLESFARELTPEVESPFRWLGQRFDRESAALQQDAENVRRRIENAFAFCEEVFPEGQELLLLVTELTVNPHSARFIGKYGCDAYYRHNRELMFYERRRELNREIAELRLDAEDGHCGMCDHDHGACDCGHDHEDGHCGKCDH